MATLAELLKPDCLALDANFDFVIWAGLINGEFDLQSRAYLLLRSADNYQPGFHEFGHVEWCLAMWRDTWESDYPPVYMACKLIDYVNAMERIGWEW